MEPLQEQNGPSTPDLVLMSRLIPTPWHQEVWKVYYSSNKSFWREQRRLPSWFKMAWEQAEEWCGFYHGQGWSQGEASCSEIWTTCWHQGGSSWAVHQLAQVWDTGVGLQASEVKHHQPSPKNLASFSIIPFSCGKDGMEQKILNIYCLMF